MSRHDILNKDEMTAVVLEIIARGYDAEVRKARGGYVVFEVKKNRVRRSSGGRDGPEKTEEN